MWSLHALRLTVTFISSLSGHPPDDPQIQNLARRLSVKTGLVKSYSDREAFYLYDQALAVIAFSRAGERGAARRVLRALEERQLDTGAWPFMFDRNGDAKGAAEQRRYSGAVAWVVMATNTYRAQTNSPRFDRMATRALEHLHRLIASVEHRGVSSRAVRFNDVDLAATPWDETELVSVEHNLDAYAAFRGYAGLTGSGRHAETARAIRAFLESMWNGEHFHAGYRLDLHTVSDDDLYLDTQSWGVLALGGHGAGSVYLRGLETNCRRMLVRDSDFGVGFRERAGVRERFLWTEGTLGMVLALRSAAAAGGAAACGGRAPGAFLLDVEGLADDEGGVPYAAGSTPSEFSTSSSVAGTAWLYFARTNYNPFRP